MVDIFQTSISGLLASQRQLATTSHNITNVNTEGYSRQRVEQVARPPMGTGAGFVGTGTQTSTVTRMVDQSRELALRQATSDAARQNLLAEYNGRVDNLLADEAAGLSGPLQDFFSATDDVANDPTSTSARQAMLSAADSLVSRFQLIDDRLRALDEESNAQINSTVSEINGLADSIASLNQEIVLARGRTGQPPNDLLDQRDNLVRELSEKVATRTVEQGDGSINVFIGNGQGLVQGSQASTLGTQPNADDPSRLDITFERSGKEPIGISGQINGGTLGGLMDFRRQVLDPTRNDLGRLAVTVGETFNQQHRLGVQFDGDAAALGGDFFRFSSPQVIPRQGNDGDAGVQVSFDPESIDRLTSSDYRATLDDGNWRVTRLSDGESWPVGDPSEPFTRDGLVFSFPDSGASDGDSFLIRPTADGASGMAVEIRRPGQVAAANPLVAGEFTEGGQAINTGNGVIERPSVEQLSGEELDALRDTGGLIFTFNADTPGYDISAANNPGDVLGTLAYDPADDSAGTTLDVSLDGLGVFAVQASGTPADDDRFVVEVNEAGVGDNANALNLARLADQGSLNGGGASYQNFYSSVVGKVGTETQRAQTNAEAQKRILDQAEADREAVSGVNLEEEAINMLKFQQAFQANAQVITVANSLFQTILGAVQR